MILFQVLVSDLAMILVPVLDFVMILVTLSDVGISLEFVMIMVSVSGFGRIEVSISFRIFDEICHFFSFMSVSDRIS